MSVQAAVRAHLAADAALLAILTGGLYPEPGVGQTELSRAGTPAAFDAFKAVKPSGLVLEDSTIPTGGPRDGAWSLARIFLWQQDGRDQLEAAQQRIYQLLQGLDLMVDGRMTSVRWAGWSPTNLRDQALGDAHLAWSRWQITRLMQ